MLATEIHCAFIVARNKEHQQFRVFGAELHALLDHTKAIVLQQGYAQVLSAWSMTASFHFMAHTQTQIFMPCALPL
jgi:flagellum-specific peptidoglycan hydrolase FlgJ